jgi:hypothetical protein
MDDAPVPTMAPEADGSCRRPAALDTTPTSVVWQLLLQECGSDVMCLFQGGVLLQAADQFVSGC